jgi:hypothetical protein
MNAAVKAMADVLERRVPELAQDDDCRAALDAAGFYDWQIYRYLDTARELARSLRIEEIERLVAELGRRG